MSEKEHVGIKEIKKLAQKFKAEELDTCINQQLNQGSNVCGLSGSNEYVINELAKAEFVRQRMDKGVSLIDAVRELASKIRNFQEFGK